MAEKNRFKKNREFKKRLDDDGSQDTDDIRSYTFKNHFAHTEERNEERKRRRTTSYADRDDKRGGRSFERGGSPSQAKAKILTARERALSAQTSAEERTLDVILLTL